ADLDTFAASATILGRSDQLRIDATRVTLLLATGDDSLALAPADEVVAAAATSADPQLSCQAILLRAQVSRRLGQARDAEQRAHQALGLATAGLPYEIVDALDLLAD